MPKGFRRDYWQIDHLAGGPLREALGQADKAAQKEMARCIHEDKGRKQASLTLESRVHEPPRPHSTSAAHLPRI